VDEAQWLTCTTPAPLLGYVGTAARVPAGSGLLPSPAEARRYQLFAAACCRRIWEYVPDPRSRWAVEVAERYADGMAQRTDLREAAAGAAAVVERPIIGIRGAGHVGALACSCAARERRNNSTPAVFDPSMAYEVAKWAAQEAGEGEPPAQADLVRCLFGNPFRPVTFDQAWRTAEVLRFARAVYAERAFERLPILADLLEEAGATDVALLGHLRGPRPHALGCHALDVVLGTR
jgi:hypothetical protein